MALVFSASDSGIRKKRTILANRLRKFLKKQVHTPNGKIAKKSPLFSLLLNIFLTLRLGNMSCFCSVQHRLRNICLPVLTCLLLFLPTPFPVLKFWSSTLDPVSHIKRKIKFQKCRLVVNYFFEHWAIVTGYHGNSSQLYWNELKVRLIC